MPEDPTLRLQKLAAIRKEVAEAELSLEHKDTLQAKIDEAIRLLEMPPAPQHADIVECVRELKDALADRIGYDVRSEVRQNARMRKAIYDAVHEAVSAAMADGFKRHTDACVALRQAAAASAATAPASGKAAEVAALDAVPWRAVAKGAALSAPKSFFAAAALVLVYLIVNGFGDKLLAAFGA